MLVYALMHPQTNAHIEIRGQNGQFDGNWERKT